MSHVVLITGANRGMGKEVGDQLLTRGYRVVFSARSLEKAQRAAGGRANAAAVRIDLRDPASIRAAAQALSAQNLHVDVLINNGAVYPSGSVLNTTDADWQMAVEANLMGAVWTCRAFAPGMVQRRWGRIVNVSSGYGSFASGLGGPAAYSITKAALNALTLQLAGELPSTVKVNAVGPGWVRTDMGGASASRSVAEGAAGIVWAATLPDDGPTGGFFRDGRRINW